VEAAGYHMIFTVHDELITETKKDFGSLEKFLEIVTVLPDWAVDGAHCPGIGPIPVTADGWRGHRYRKG